MASAVPSACQICTVIVPSDIIRLFLTYLKTFLSDVAALGSLDESGAHIFWFVSKMTAHIFSLEVRDGLFL
jgi:hypothetical protein